jgi:hypothetical protein
VLFVADQVGFVATGARLPHFYLVVFNGYDPHEKRVVILLCLSAGIPCYLAARIAFPISTCQPGVNQPPPSTEGTRSKSAVEPLLVVRQTNTCNSCTSRT